MIPISLRVLEILEQGSPKALPEFRNWKKERRVTICLRKREENEEKEEEKMKKLLPKRTVELLTLQQSWTKRKTMTLRKIPMSLRKQMIFP